MKRAILIIAAVATSMLAGCTTAAVAWEAAAAQQIQQANDNALSLWKRTGCAMPVGAILRDPDVIDSINRFCGGAKSQLGASQPITVNVTIPAASAAK